jgi:hypothetical protein
MKAYLFVCSPTLDETMKKWIDINAGDGAEVSDTLTWFKWSEEESSMSGRIFSLRVYDYTFLIYIFVRGVYVIGLCLLIFF